MRGLERDGFYTGVASGIKREWDSCLCGTHAFFRVNPVAAPVHSVQRACAS